MKKAGLIILFLFIALTYGQTQPPPPPPDPIPIDGGLFLLLLGGVILGGREVYLHEKRKKKH